MAPSPATPATPSALGARAAFLLLLLPSSPPRAVGRNVASAWTPKHDRRSAAARPRRPARTAAGCRPLPAGVGGSDAAHPAAAAGVPPASPVMAAYEADARGRDLTEGGNLVGAVDAFRAAASLHPTPERHLRLGLALEENGEPREAVGAYETARGLSNDPVLRHDVSLKLAHVWADDLGDTGRAIAWADAAMAEGGYGESAGAMDRKAVFLAAEGRLGEALQLWDRAIERAEDLGDGVDDARFFRAVARERAGLADGAAADLASLPASKSYMVDSWRYVRSHPPTLPGTLGWDRLFSGTHTHLSDALAAARPDGGLVCEFGVFHGKSIRLLAEMVGPGAAVDGFDTFEGIPEDWGDEAAGTYTAAAQIPAAPDNVRFHVGLFADTLPGYVAGLPPPERMPARLINVDCDLYQGTVEILQYLAPRIGPGTVLLFDEYLMHPTWPEDEYRAFQEACAKYGWRYEYLAFSLVSKQAIVRITASDSFVGPPAPAPVPAGSWC